MPYSPMELAEAFIKTGELSDALDALNQQIAAAPQDAAARRLRAGVLLRLRGGDQLQAALTDLDSLTNLTTQDYLQRSVIFERLGDLAGALAAISTARAVYPSDERLVERQLHLLVAQGNIPAARALVAELPKTWRWLQWAGDLALRAGDAQAAVDDYSQAIQHFESVSAGLVDSYAKPISTRLHIARGHAHRQLGQIADAQADYAAAREGIPNDPLIDFNLGLTYALLGNLNRALECCRAALEASNAVLRAEIERDLQDPRYAELAQQLRTNNQ